MEWLPITTDSPPRNGEPVLLGYQAEGVVHLVSKYAVGEPSWLGMCDWPWTMEPTHWLPIPTLPPKTAQQKG